MNRPNPIATTLPRYQGMTFPTDFGFYRSSMSDLVIAHHKNNPPLFYISTNNGFSSKPSVVLHSGPSQAQPPLAFALFHSFSSTIDIKIGNNVVYVNKESAFSSTYSFTFAIQGRLEKFEWKNSSGAEVQALNGSSHGMKLVRVATGSVVAAWTRPHSGTAKQGKMKFRAKDRGALGNDFEKVVVISIAAIMEKLRRAAKRRQGATTSNSALSASSVSGPSC